MPTQTKRAGAKRPAVSEITLQVPGDWMRQVRTLATYNDCTPEGAALALLHHGLRDYKLEPEALELDFITALRQPVP